MSCAAVENVAICGKQSIDGRSQWTLLPSRPYSRLAYAYVSSAELSNITRRRVTEIGSARLTYPKLPADGIRV